MWILYSFFFLYSNYYLIQFAIRRTKFTKIQINTQYFIICIFNAYFIKVKKAPEYYTISRLNSQLYPEYYILKVNDFNRIAKTPLEEWIYYLNTENMPEHATAPGLDTVKEQLKLGRMSREELKAYYKHLDNIIILRNNIMTERAEGRAEEKIQEIV